MLNIICLRILFIATVIFAVMCIYSICHGKYEMTKAHELGHARAIEDLSQQYNLHFPIYILLYKDSDSFGWAGKTVSYLFSRLKENNNLEAIQKIAKAGKLAEYEEIHNHTRSPKFYRFCRNISFKWEMIICENSDGHYVKHPNDFIYRNIQYFIAEQKKRKDKRKRKNKKFELIMELYLYTDNKLRKIMYKDDLPELQDPYYEFKFIEDDEDSFLEQI